MIWQVKWTETWDCLVLIWPKDWVNLIWVFFEAGTTLLIFSHFIILIIDSNSKMDNNSKFSYSQTQIPKNDHTLTQNHTQIPQKILSIFIFFRIQFNYYLSKQICLQKHFWKTYIHFGYFKYFSMFKYLKNIKIPSIIYVFGSYLGYGLLKFVGIWVWFWIWVWWFLGIWVWVSVNT